MSAQHTSHFRILQIPFLLFIFLFALGTPQASASILLQDDFNDNSLDPTKWTTNANIARGPASVTETNQHLEIVNRGHLITTQQFDPFVVGPLAISGTWVFPKTGLPDGDFMQILTRSDGIPDNSNFGETKNGILFMANANGNGNLQIVSMVNSVGNLLATMPFHFVANQPYAFTILDNGINLSLTLSELFGTHSSSTLTATSSNVYAQNHVVFHNREANNGNGHELAILDNVVIESLTPPVPEPSSTSARVMPASYKAR